LSIIIKMISKTNPHSRLSSTNTKSSANFVSLLCPKQSQKLKNGKLTVQYSKIFKPSVKLYAEYLNKSSVSSKKSSKGSSSDSEDISAVNFYEVSQRIRAIYEDFQLRPFMQILKGYKQEKSKILQEKSLEKEARTSVLNTLKEENAALEAELASMPEKIEKISQEEVQKHLNKFSSLGCKTELTDAICAEFCSFKISKSWTAVQKLNAQITEFFSMAELQDSYNDIISTFCKQISLEIGRTQAAKDKASKLTSQKGNVVRVFETLKAFETGVSISSVYN